MVSNIVLKENSAFGRPNYNVVRTFLNMVDMNMMSALEQPFFSTKRCQVIYRGVALGMTMGGVTAEGGRVDKKHPYYLEGSENVCIFATEKEILNEKIFKRY